ncbi:MAG: hypothetical protein AAGA56_15280, partial [Myxococcota bacterium]
ERPSAYRPGRIARWRPRGASDSHTPPSAPTPARPRPWLWRRKVHLEEWVGLIATPFFLFPGWVWLSGTTVFGRSTMLIAVVLGALAFVAGAPVVAAFSDRGVHQFFASIPGIFFIYGAWELVRWLADLAEGDGKEGAAPLFPLLAGIWSTVTVIWLFETDLGELVRLSIEILDFFDN